MSYELNLGEKKINKFIFKPILYILTTYYLTLTTHNS
jgi:hypothetical protein